MARTLDKVYIPRKDSPGTTTCILDAGTDYGAASPDNDFEGGNETEEEASLHDGGYA